MPVTPDQPVYAPPTGTAIEAVWGQAVSEGVIQRFGSAAERDAKWTNPPDGALAFHDNIVWIRRPPEGFWASPWYPLTMQTAVIHVHINDARAGVVVDLRPQLPPALYPATVMVEGEGYNGYSMVEGNFSARFITPGENGPQPNNIGWQDYFCEFTFNEGLRPQGRAYWEHIGHGVLHRTVDTGVRPNVSMILLFSGSINAYWDFYITANYVPGKGW